MKTVKNMFNTKPYFKEFNTLWEKFITHRNNGKKRRKKLETLCGNRDEIKQSGKMGKKTEIF